MAKKLGLVDENQGPEGEGEVQMEPQEAQFPKVEIDEADAKARVLTMINERRENLRHFDEESRRDRL